MAVEQQRLEDELADAPHRLFGPALSQRLEALEAQLSKVAGAWRAMKLRVEDVKNELKALQSEVAGEAAAAVAEFADEKAKQTKRLMTQLKGRWRRRSRPTPSGSSQPATNSRLLPPRNSGKRSSRR